MLAWPAKGKLVKQAKLVCPGREPNSRSGAVTTVSLAIQVAAQIGGSARGYQGLSARLATPTTAEQEGGLAVCSCHGQRWT
jgi:hypothetical protein